jgi:predicted acetyltransferase
MNVALISTTRSQESVLQNLIQLYTHDFSEFWAGTPKGDLEENGLFAPYPLAEYWNRPNWSASIILCDGLLAGFALINDCSHTDEAVNRNVAEFFIVRKYRGRGVGRIAATNLLSQFPGTWEVAIARKNIAALSFWRRTIGGTIQARAIHEIDASGNRWNGPIIRFEWST